MEFDRSCVDSVVLDGLARARCMHACMQIPITGCYLRLPWTFNPRCIFREKIAAEGDGGRKKKKH